MRVRGQINTVKMMTTKTQNDGRLVSSDDAKPKTHDEIKHIKLEDLINGMEAATMRLSEVKRDLEATMEYSFHEDFDIDRWMEVSARFEEALRSSGKVWDRWVWQAAEGVKD